MPEFLGFSGGDAGQSAATLQAQQNQLGIDEIRRQFNLSQENLDPFIQAGQGQLGALTQGASAGGLDERLGQIFGSQNFQNLTQERERAVQGGLSAGGLSRSGFGLQQLANVPTELGFALEQLLTGRSQQLAGSGQSAAAGLGGLGAQAGGQAANLFSNTGSALASGSLADSQARAEANKNIGEFAATAANIFFSDPALKENVEQIGMIRDLNLVQWDWINETKDTMISACGNMGFMADQVLELYPQHVTDFCGFLTIDYPSLLTELEAV